MNKDLNKNILITPNSIARGKYAIDAKENNLFLKIMYQIQRDYKEYLVVKRKDEILTESDINKWEELNSRETLDTTLSFADISEIYKHTADLSIDNIKKNLNILKSCEISIDTQLRDGTKATLCSGLISHYYIIEGSKDFKIVVPTKIYKFLFDLGLGHSQNALQILYNLRSQYSQRLYLMLRSWSGAKRTINFSVEELRAMLKLENKYPSYKLFKANVIKRALAEINETGVMEVEILDEIKVGRNIKNIVFKVVDKEKRNYMELFEKADTSVIWLDYIKVQDESLLERLKLKYSDVDLNSPINQSILCKAYDKTLARDNRFKMIEDRKNKTNYALFNHIASGEFLTNELQAEEQFKTTSIYEL